MARSSPTALIASPSNPRIKAAAGLRDARDRAERGLSLVDGARELRRALDAGIEVVEAFVHEPLLAGADARAVLDALAARGIPLQPTTEAAIGKLAFGSRAEGIVAVIRVPPLGLERLAVPSDPLIVVVDSVEKPGNLGAILRSADGAGADAVVAAAPRTDLLNPNVIRASAGTVFAVPLAAASTEEVVAWLRATAVRILTTRVDRGRTYTDVDLTGPVALVLGSEADGLGPAWAGDDIEAVHLPMHGIADSLNVSVTAAVLLYEARRQRDRRPGGPD
ncbi:MAG TPA: TrmH family RNA methyltransferase [Candidatus Saccharimonadales bacterium]|nr:TrmH family RNA methyltransferase [Candidatus Saccharimonadales bacterium]